MSKQQTETKTTPEAKGPLADLETVKSKKGGVELTPGTYNIHDTAVTIAKKGRYFVSKKNVGWPQVGICNECGDERKPGGTVIRRDSRTGGTYAIMECKNPSCAKHGFLLAVYPSVAGTDPIVIIDIE